VKLWGIKPYLGLGIRKMSLSGDASYVKATKIESSELNTLYEVGVKFPIFQRVFGSIDYKRGEPVNLDTDMSFAHLKTTLGSDLVSASVHIALF
jgi:outer membrane protein W